ncbi:hypothetical protein Bb109J_c1968 [Bdellovibrio bacteriovorus]|uniref:helix-turn-helix domain-containing protein n=1 Tax=Bdellovibrio bacteriovorus TaxID=959 RepID=UPI00130D651F|nr:helix-turn-helix transcriptional regulator [Bdellovibrio bacteriovorus]BEV68548.1 hypothetical protein Bb109J_c1968 [Bdellovibrio bacteriovorus]
MSSPVPLSSLRSMGSFLKTKRIEQKVSQKKIALELGVTDAFVCRIESGEKALPDYGIPAVARVLGISTSDLVSRKLEYYREVIENEIAIANTKTA